eukprot:6961327-Prymnesium_polylepis.1
MRTRARPKPALACSTHTLGPRTPHSAVSRPRVCVRGTSHAYIHCDHSRQTCMQKLQHARNQTPPANGAAPSKNAPASQSAKPISSSSTAACGPERAPARDRRVLVWRGREPLGFLHPRSA